MKYSLAADPFLLHASEVDRLFALARPASWRWTPLLFGLEEVAALRIKVFGEFQVWRDDAPITREQWASQKTQDLLKLLVTEREHIVPRERLMDLLWPKLAPQSADLSLRVAISRLRRLLEPELPHPACSSLIITHQTGYAFHPASDSTIDVIEFLSAFTNGQHAEQRGQWGVAIAAYQAADELYCGEFLEENPYADWARSAREQLHEVHLEALSRLAECHAHLSQHRRALAACRKALAIDEVREAVYRQMMAYYYRLGERDLALRVFERCRSTLTTALGVDPMPETLDLHMKILRGDNLDGNTPVEPLVCAAGTSPAPLTQPPSAVSLWLPHVGRQAELAQLGVSLHSALRGEGQIVLIAGEPGVGKTRLAQELLALAEDRGAQVYIGQAYAAERNIPYQPVREALREQLLKRLRADQARRILGPWASHIALLLPELRLVLTDLPVLPALPPDEEHQRVLEGLTQFCLALARRGPLALLLDDLQWADSATLCFLHALVRRTRTAAVLVIGTYVRTALEPDHPLVTVERYLERGGALAHLELQPLLPGAIDELVAIRAAPGWNTEHFARRLWEESEGNPLFLSEFLESLLQCGALRHDVAGRWEPSADIDFASLVAPLSATTQTLIEARCHAISDAARRLLRVAAVIGRNFHYEMLQRVAGLTTDAFLDGLEELAARGLIEALGAPGLYSHRFSHGKIRDVIFAGVCPERRAQLQLKLAEAGARQHDNSTITAQ